MAAITFAAICAGIRGELLELMMKWADTAEIKWCFVDEARPEVTRSRDGQSPLTEFTGRSVVVLGCGAIGSHLADHIMRVNPSNLTVVDKSIVRYGNLSRQKYDGDDLTKGKAASLARRLGRISSDVPVTPLSDDALDFIANPDSDLWQADIVIDATANVAVSKRLEAALGSRSERPWILSMLLGHRGDRGLLTALGPGAIGGPVRAIRETKLKVIGTPRLQSFADEFWPDPPRSDLFLPEPGCSAPTFVGANADVAAVVGALARAAGEALRAAEPAAAMLLELADASSRTPARSEHLRLVNPIQLREAIAGHQVHVEQRVMTEIKSVIRQGGRNDAGSETGGLLFGDIDDATQTITVTYALGPPPDSQSSPSGFVCGTAGVDAACAALAEASRGTHIPIGMWHTHPNGNPSASPTDLEGMRFLTGQRERPLPQQLLMIGGGDPLGSTWNTYLFERRHRGAWPTTVPIALADPIPTTGRVGLALSGGGLRAAAFHLGCMRALHDRSLLDDVRLISGVSGGSLVAAMWAYEDTSFNDFDARVSELLNRGLVSRIVQRWMGPKRLARAAAVTATAGLASAPNALMGRGGNRPRSTSSLTALEESLDEFFGEALLSDVARADVDVIINACDLRTGSAFRFGNIESGTWRLGVIKGNDVRVARAVACSAAYPLAFPAHDSIETLERRDGSEHQRRLILTDGGIFDNLGTSALLPDRSADFSTNVHAPLDWVIACDAGRGMSSGTARPYWFMDRLKRSFEATYKKGQDTERARLFELGNRPGPVKGFVVAMLGMNDANLPIPIADLIPRESVIDVKTSFTALPQDDIERLTRRGEQIMGSLIARYGPHP